MDLKELKTKSDQELELSLKEFREKLRKLSFDLAEKKLKNVGEISESRKTIARILTLLRSHNAPAVAKALADGQALLRKNASDGQALLRKNASDGQVLLRKNASDGQALLRKNASDGQAILK